jgi:CheY-like chemotaxis protein/two-component sensor histidine kinase
VIEAGQITVSMERVDLVPLMKSVVATLEQSARKSDIALVAQDYGAGMPPLMADRVRLAQVLLNLGSNAIKYNRPGGRIRFAYEQTDDTVRLSVEDTGIGIPADRQKELFRPFNRLGAENRAIEGTGVGLALSGRLVEVMSGTIGFSSREGEGSCFWVDIPVYRTKPGDAEAEATGAASEEPAPRGFSVLYVEDNPANLALVRNIFATLEDVKMFEAEHGRAGFEMAERHRPDVIILDLNLPDMSGYAVLDLIKRTRELAATPVLALSAGVLTHEIQRGLDAGFFRYITKPLKLSDFLGAIQAALDSRRQEIAASE